MRRLRIEDRPAAGRLPGDLPPRTRAGRLCKTNPISAIATVESPQHSTIPSFHHSNALPIVRNKPNSPTGPSTGPVVPNDPNWPHTDRHGRRLAGPRSLAPLETIAPNKPNFQPGRWTGKCCVEKELWSIGSTKRRGETKPISAGTARGEVRQGLLYKQTQFAPERRDGQVLCEKRVMVSGVCQGVSRNKANFRADRNGRRPAGPVGQTNPIYPAGPGGTGLGGGSTMQNEPNSRLRRQGRVWSLWCETKPIFRGRAEAMDAESATMCRPRPKGRPGRIIVRPRR
jgi:hypothetical protein